MAAYAYRGKRVAYDNIAAGSIAGVEKPFSGSVSDVSPMGDAAVAGAGGGAGSNIAAGSPAGIEDTDNTTGDKLTSDGERVA